MKNKTLSMAFSLMAALAATFVLTIGVLADAPGGSGNASAIAGTSSSDDWVIEEEWDNGASARAGALVGETSSGTANADSQSTTYNSGADAYSSAFIGWESSGTANASAEARSTNKPEADADATAFAWIIFGSNGKADASALAEALHDSYAEADSFAKLIDGASGSVAADSRAVAANGAYADAEAVAILEDAEGNLISWAWATADGHCSYADSEADIDRPGQDCGTPLSPGVYFDYDAIGGSYAIAILLIQDPTNIFSIAITNAVGGNGAWAESVVDGNDVFVDADVDDHPSA